MGRKDGEEGKERDENDKGLSWRKGQRVDLSSFPLSGLS